MMNEEYIQNHEQWLQHDDHLYEVLQVAALDLLAEVKRLRWIARNCLQAIEAGGDYKHGKTGTIMIIEENLKSVEMIE